MKLKYLLIILVVILLIGAGASYWYFFTTNGEGTGADIENPSDSGGFVPLPRPSNAGSNTPTATPGTPTNSTSTTTDPVVIQKLPALRQISGVPVGGYGASTTPSTTLVRWVDRGRGNVYELASDSSTVVTLSNTIVPRVAESSWNRNATAFIGTLLSDTGADSNVVFAELQKETATGSAPFTLKGKNFPDNVLTYAVSPKKDRLFLILKENGNGVGYTASVNGGPLTRIMSTPLTQVTIEWPEDNTITLTTNASAGQDGFLYFINPKTGSMKKILGPTRGLTAITSRDAKYIFASYATPQGNLASSFYNVAKGTMVEAGFLTLAEKCTWGNSYKDTLYCGVPNKIEAGVYPDDWHLGTVSFADRIWQANAVSSEIKLLSTPAEQAAQLVDAFRLDLDSKDDFLFFMNKNDLSLWSLDLVSSQ